MGVDQDIKRDIANAVVKALQEEIEFDGLVFTGQLKNSWEIHEEPDTGDVIIGSRLIWARVLDEGRLPGKMPPMKGLFPWVLQKIGGKDEAEIKRIAFAVARKIAEKGIEPRNYVRRALFFLERSSQ